MRGDGIAELTRRMADRMNVSRSNARRLIQTESAYFAAMGEMDSMKELGVKKYKYLATLDSRTSETCRGMDGKIFDVTDYKPGTTAPPLHVYCRSTTIPYYGRDGKLRAARADEIAYSPNMNYKDWYSVFVDKTKPLNTWKAEEIKKKLSATDLANCSFRDIIEIGKDVCEAFDVEANIGNKSELKIIFSNFRDMGSQVPESMWAKGSNTANKKMLNEAFSYYPREWADYLRKTNRQLYTTKIKRGFFQSGAVMGNGKYYNTKLPNYRDGYVTIHMDGVRKTTPYHEIGHMVEFFNSNALRISKQFLAMRTRGESLVSLKKIFPTFNYRQDEMTKPDDFISPYIGKEYSDASEVLSMGLEQIFEPTRRLKKIRIVNGQQQREYATIRDDKEYLYLIVGLLLKA